MLRLDASVGTDLGNRGLAQWHWQRRTRIGWLLSTHGSSGWQRNWNWERTRRSTRLDVPVGGPLWILAIRGIRIGTRRRAAPAIPTICRRTSIHPRWRAWWHGVHLRWCDGSGACGRVCLPWSRRGRCYYGWSCCCWCHLTTGVGHAVRYEALLTCTNVIRLTHDHIPYASDGILEPGLIVGSRNTSRSRLQSCAGWHELRSIGLRWYGIIFNSSVWGCGANQGSNWRRYGR